MNELKQTGVFRVWWTKLKDERARGVIAGRLDRLAYGLLGDVEPVGDGSKSTQARDIRTAKRLADEWKE